MSEGAYQDRARECAEAYGDGYRDAERALSPQISRAIEARYAAEAALAEQAAALARAQAVCEAFRRLRNLSRRRTIKGAGYVVAEPYVWEPVIEAHNAWLDALGAAPGGQGG